MKINQYIAIISVILVIGGLSSCTKNLDVSGTIKYQGITTYMYGTHVIETSDGIYAIQSETVNLDDLLDQYVTLHAEVVPGYPVDGGPVLLEVSGVD